MHGLAVRGLRSRFLCPRSWRSRFLSNPCGIVRGMLVSSGTQVCAGRVRRPRGYRPARERIAPLCRFQSHARLSRLRGTRARDTHEVAPADIVKTTLEAQVPAVPGGGVIPANVMGCLLPFVGRPPLHPRGVPSLPLRLGHAGLRESPAVQAEELGHFALGAGALGLSPAGDALEPFTGGSSD